MNELVDFRTSLIGAAGREIDLTGSAMSELIASTLGGALACVCLTILSPVLAIYKVEDRARAGVATLVSSWKDLTTCAYAKGVFEVNEFVKSRTKRAKAIYLVSS